jgi:hypothetical protein
MFLSIFGLQFYEDSADSRGHHVDISKGMKMCLHKMLYLIYGLLP